MVKLYKTTANLFANYLTNLVESYYVKIIKSFIEHFFNNYFSRHLSFPNFLYRILICFVVTDFFINFFSVRINDTVTFVEDGFDEDIEFGDEVSDEGGDPVDAVSFFNLFGILKLFHQCQFKCLIIQDIYLISQGTG